MATQFDNDIHTSGDEIRENNKVINGARFSVKMLLPPTKRSGFESSWMRGCLLKYITIKIVKRL